MSSPTVFGAARTTDEAISPRRPRRRVRLAVTRRALWAVLIVGLFTAPAIALWAKRAPTPPPVLLSLPSFELESQDGVAFGSRELGGKVYAAAFVFTSCPSVCPRVMGLMVELAERTRHLGAAFRLVAFTVDPENDTPEVLRAFGRRHGADPGRFTFLRGDIAEVQRVVVEGFKLAMGRDDQAEMGIFHSDRLVLVDRAGAVRGYYESTPEGIAELGLAAEALVVAAE